jgi:hypothetical protein
MFSHGEHFLTRGDDFGFWEEEAVVAGVAEFDAEGVADFALCVGPIDCRAAINNASLSQSCKEEEG